MTTKPTLRKVNPSSGPGAVAYILLTMAAVLAYSGAAIGVWMESRGCMVLFALPGLFALCALCGIYRGMESGKT